MEHLEWLVSKLPNLREINVGASGWFDYYMHLLGTIDNTQYLNKVTKIENGFNACLYFLTCYRFRHTLTHLSLHNDRYTKNYDSFLHRLQQFTSLPDLVFYNTYDETLTLFEILAV